MADEADPNRDPKPANAAPAWTGMASVGFEFVLAILIPGALGWWLDGRFGWRPWLMLAGGLLGGLLFVAWSLALLWTSLLGCRWVGAAFAAVLAIGIQTDVIGVPWIGVVVWALAADAARAP